jgi:O-antigen/teichoic acid export membrane protein
MSVQSFLTSAARRQSGILHGSAVLAVGIGITNVLSVLTYVVGARVLGPSDFGRFVAVISIAFLFVVVSDFGVNAWTVREIARSGYSMRPFEVTLLLKVALAGVGATVWVVLAIATRGEWSIPLAFYMFSSVVGAALLVPFRARRQMTFVAIAQCAGTAVALCIALGIAWTHLLSLATFGISQAVGSAVALAIAVLAVETSSLRRGLRFYPRAFPWRAALSFGLYGLAGQMRRFDTALVAAIAGTVAAGLYGAPARLYGLLSVLPAAYSLMVFSSESSRSAGSVAPRSRTVVGAVVFLVTALMLASIFVLASPLVGWVLGPAFGGAAVILKLFCVSMLFATVTQPVAAYLQAHGADAYVGRMSFLNSTAGLSGIAIGAGIAGARGAATAAVIQEIALLGALAPRLVSARFARPKTP